MRAKEGIGDEAGVGDERWIFLAGKEETEAGASKGGDQTGRAEADRGDKRWGVGLARVRWVCYDEALCRASCKGAWTETS